MNQPLRSCRSLDEMPAPEPESVTAYLRRISREARERVHHHALMPNPDQAGYSLGRYVSLLAAYYHLYGAMERQIEDYLSQSALPFDYRERRKLPWLTADLWHFGVGEDTPGLKPLRPISLTPMNDSGALVGTLYVLEGATLSGQTISRSVAYSLKLSPGTGARFFHGYGDPLDTLKRWQEFGVLSETIRHSPPQRQSAEVATLTLFSLIEEQLNDYHARLEQG